ncbi:MAG TPA: glycosyltransferase family A protein [Vicinamibacterales bacterium]
MPRTPKVTILVPVFNRERFVAEAIGSVVGQGFGDFELLLVDDGSTDRTGEILRELGRRDARVKVVTSEGNEGIPRALNKGLAHARGEYIARLDSDDLMMPERLAAQVDVLDREKDVVLVSTEYAPSSRSSGARCLTTRSRR